MFSMYKIKRLANSNVIMDIRPSVHLSIFAGFGADGKNATAS